MPCFALLSLDVKIDKVVCNEKLLPEVKFRETVMLISTVSDSWILLQ